MVYAIMPIIISKIVIIFSYKGEFKFNFIHGYGLFKWNDGKEYEGNWENN